MVIAVVLALATFVTSIVSGVLGMAGGVALIGLMAVIMANEVVVPVHGVTQLFANGARTFLMLKHVRWREVGIYTLPLIGGVIAGVRFGSGFDYDWLEPLLGLVLISFIAWRRAQPKIIKPPDWVYVVVGFGTGFLSLFVGATGPLAAIVFRRDDWEPNRVVATMAVAQTLTHLLKIPAFLRLGFDYAPYLPLLAALFVAALAGTWVGKHMLSKLSKERFGTIFDFVLAVLAAWLILRAVL